MAALPIVCNRRIFQAVKTLTDAEIKELQDLAEANRQIPHWHRRGVRLIQLKRVRQSRKVG
jgi:hypothetical protein